MAIEPIRPRWPKSLARGQPHNWLLERWCLGAPNMRQVCK